MAWIWLIEKWKRILFPAFCLILSGCGHYLPLYDPPPSGSMGTVIHAGTQASFKCDDEILSIASGTNYYSAEYIDEFGNQRQGMISGLYFSLWEKREQARFYSAYTGLTIYYYSIKIEILGIGADRIDEFTEVDVGIMNQSGEVERCSGY
jgi:hypothetical protein